MTIGKQYGLKTEVLMDGHSHFIDKKLLRDLEEKSYKEFLHRGK